MYDYSHPLGDAVKRARERSGLTQNEAPQKILCKRYSTKSRISRFQSAWMGFVPLVHISPGRVGRYARRYGVNAVQPCRECYFKGISLPCGRRT